MARFLSVTDYENDYNITSETGRIAIWKIGVNLTLSNPITGVGVKCFPMAIGYYRSDTGLIPRWQRAHNSYLQVSSELGLIGFFVFISIIISCIKNFSYFSKKEISLTKSDEIKTIGGLVLIGFIGSLIPAFFLSQAYSILFTLYFAFSAAMRKLIIFDEVREYPR